MAAAYTLHSGQQCVAQTEESCAVNVCWLTDSVPKYLTDADPHTFSYVLSEDELMRRANTPNDPILYYAANGGAGLLADRQEAIETNARVRRETGVEEGKVLAPLELVVLDEEKLRNYVSSAEDGAVDLDAINRGEQVLLCAPDRYLWIETRDDGSSIGSRMSNRPFAGATLVAHNDGDFTAGETLELMLLSGPETNWTEQSAEGFYAGLEKRRAARYTDGRE